MADFSPSKRVSPFDLKPPPPQRNIPSPPAGFALVPHRPDDETIPISEFIARVGMYKRAYVKLTANQWHNYISFGIQTFSSFEEYFETISALSEDHYNLRIAHYYKFHLETNLVVNSTLLKRVAEVEYYLDATNHAGFLSLSTRQMESYMEKPFQIEVYKPNTPESVVTNYDSPYFPPNTDIDGEDVEYEDFDNEDDISMHIPSQDDMQAFESLDEIEIIEEGIDNGVLRLFDQFEQIAAESGMDLEHTNSSLKLSENTTKEIARAFSTKSTHLKSSVSSLQAAIKKPTGASLPTLEPLTGLQSTPELVKPIPINDWTDRTANDFPVSSLTAVSIPINDIPLSPSGSQCKTTKAVPASSLLSTPPRHNRSENRKSNGIETPKKVPVPTDPKMNGSPNKQTSFKTNVSSDKTISNDPIIRVEVRWAPKDFSRLRNSAPQMHERLAPILSQINKHPVRLVEWQTDQLAPLNQIILPSQVSKHLSIRIITSAKQQCFYFSLRVKSTGHHFIKALKEKGLRNTIKGESIQFSPSSIDCKEGEIVSIGDILLKDAEITHRQKYVEYLRREIFPENTPPFDLKIKRKDPLNNRTQILTIKCSSRHALSLTKLFSEALDGDGISSEIFISNIGLATHKTTRLQHEQLYRIHQEFLSDSHRIEFPQTRFIDQQIQEHLDSGEVILRSPRQWAKQLKNAEGNYCGIDIESGAANGKTYLITPSFYLQYARECLTTYLRQQNPALMKASAMSANIMPDPSIPSVVFTKNITRLLTKTFSSQKSYATGSLNSNDEMDVDAVGNNKDEKNKSRNAWKTPLTTILRKQSKKKANVSTLSSSHPSLTTVLASQTSESDDMDITMNIEMNEGSPAPTNTTISSLTFASREQAHLKRIAELEARLNAAESLANDNDNTSGVSAKQPAHKNEKHTSDSVTHSEAETVESRLNDLETAIFDIKNMLNNISLNHSKPPLSVHTQSTAEVSYSTGVSESPHSYNTGTANSSPTKNPDAGFPPAVSKQPNFKKHAKPISTASLSVLTKELQQRERHLSTSDYTQLTVLSKRVPATLSSPPSTPSGKKRCTQDSPRPVITAMLSQYANNDHSSATVK